MGGSVLVFSEWFSAHVPPRKSGHLEEPGRLKRALKALDSYGVSRGWRREKPGQQSIRYFERVHDPAYIQGLLSELEVALDSYFVDSDTYVSPGTQGALEALAGSAVLAVDLVSGGSAERVFILGRPPGHHAGVNGPGLGAPSLGGCLVNTAAAVAVDLARRGSTAIVDFDLHHGNGTQEILQALRPEGVFMVDVHQDFRKTFPWTGSPGEGAEAGVLNINLPEGAGDDVMEAVVEGVRGLLEEASPEYVVVSAGFGLYQGDSPLTLTRLTSRSFHLLGEALSKWRLVAVLELGFQGGLERGLPAFLAGLQGSGDPVGDEATVSGEEAWREFEELNKDIAEFY